MDTTETETFIRAAYKATSPGIVMLAQKVRALSKDNAQLRALDPRGMQLLRDQRAGLIGLADGLRDTNATLQNIIAVRDAEITRLQGLLAERAKSDTFKARTPKPTPKAKPKKVEDRITNKNAIKGDN